MATNVQKTTENASRTRALDPFEFDKAVEKFWLHHEALHDVVSWDDFVLGSLLVWDKDGVLEELNSRERSSEDHDHDGGFRGFARFRKLTKEQATSIDRFLSETPLIGWRGWLYEKYKSRIGRGQDENGHLHPSQHGGNFPIQLQPFQRRFVFERKTQIYQLLSLGNAHLTILCMGILAAVTQGWDQSSINGANLTWPPDLGLDVPRLISSSDTNKGSDIGWFAFANAAPWFSGAIVGSLFTDYFINEQKWGRRMAIAWAAAFSVASVVGAAYAHNWETFVACRILLGLGMGGMLVMSWQLFDTFGIFIGNLSNLMVFLDNEVSTWRTMIALPFIPALMLLTLMPFCVESPRWLLKQNRMPEALHSLARLHELPSPLIACGELYNTYLELKREETEYLGQLETPAPDVSNRNAQTALPFSSGAERVTTTHPARAPSSQLQRDTSPVSSISSISSIPSSHSITSGPADQSSNVHIDTPVINQATTSEANDQRLRPTSLGQRLSLFWKIPRIQNAAYASASVMFAQQACGINILIFMSSTIYESVVADDRDPEKGLPYSDQRLILALSMVIGFVNHIFTWFSFFLIDARGRRFILKISFPLMAALLLICGIVLYSVKDVTTSYWIFFALTLAFVIAFSIGEGPVAFVVSAEVYPLLVREIGMSFSVFINFFLAGGLTLAIPHMAIAGFKGWFWFLFSGLNVLSLLLAYIFVQDAHNTLLENVDEIYEREKKAWLIDHLDRDLGGLGQILIQRIPWFAPKKEDMSSDNLTTS